MNDVRIKGVRAIAEAVLAAIPVNTASVDGRAARFDMERAHDNPEEFFADLGNPAAQWALEAAVCETANHTASGFIDEASETAHTEFFWS